MAQSRVRFPVSPLVRVTQLAENPPLRIMTEASGVLRVRIPSWANMGVWCRGLHVMLITSWFLFNSGYAYHLLVRIVGVSSALWSASGRPVAVGRRNLQKVRIVTPVAYRTVYCRDDPYRRYSSR